VAPRALRCLLQYYDKRFSRVIFLLPRTSTAECRALQCRGSDEIPDLQRFAVCAAATRLPHEMLVAIEPRCSGCRLVDAPGACDPQRERERERERAVIPGSGHWYGARCLVFQRRSRIPSSLSAEAPAVGASSQYQDPCPPGSARNNRALRRPCQRRCRRRGEFPAGEVGSNHKSKAKQARIELRRQIGRE
jgi:hypothetical protein